MATLTGTTIQSTYDSLLKVTDNDAITSTLKRITDGLGNNTPLYLSSSAVEITSGLNVIGSLTASNVSGSNTGDETKASIETKLGAATSSNNGYLTSGDWSTFNNKIAGSGTLNSIAKFSSTGSITDSNIADTGSLITLGSNTYVNGNLGIGSTSLTGININLSRNITGASTSIGFQSAGTVQSDVTTVRYLSTTSSTAAGSYTISDLSHYIATQGTFGAGSTVTNQYAFFAGASLTGATNNYLYYGNMPSGTGRWNLFMNGTANNYINGALGIGSTALTGYNLRISRNLTGAITSRSLHQDVQIQSDVTNAALIFSSLPSTQATTFTLPAVTHFNADQGTFGAGSTVTNQYGFLAAGALIGATNNYGFFGSIAAGTGRWNLFMNGTANNYINGALGISTQTLAGFNINIARNLTGAVTARGIQQAYTIQSDVTNAAIIYSSGVSTAAATFTLPQLTHYFAGQGAIGAGSTVTDQHGFRVESTLIGATNNYGFRGQIASGTGRWNLYMDGTARNYLAGTTSIGSTTNNGTGALLQVAGGITYTNIFNRQTANYTLALTDQNDIVETNVNTANTITVPTNASVAFPIGTEIFVIQYGSGETSFVAASGVTIRSDNFKLTISNQYKGACLVKVGTNEWYLIGSLK